ncbi:endonuclease domain-containing protein, partial [Klebsiella pneumoniae]|uniref:endonuclease domain-containing protein n=1 Tax=Klebsiella pneumoniae TaxID=573 RepID=UPI00117AB48C
MFFDDLYDIAEKTSIIYSFVVPMEPLSDLQELCHQMSVVCYLCSKGFSDENVKVRDHDHLTGIYRGAASNSCNINYKLPNFIPVVLHNLSG